MSSKLEVLWSPNRGEHFATYTSEVKLYCYTRLQEEQREDLGTADLQLSAGSEFYGRFIAGSNDVHCMPQYQCVAWQTNAARQHFFAVGQSSGKVVLTNLGLDDPSLSNHYLAPKSGRPCTCLAWNSNENNLVAVGLEKARNDSSLIVWDITRASSEHVAEKTNRFWFGPDIVTAGEESAKQFEVGHTEQTSSLAWFPNQPCCLLAGMGSRFLRIFDIREQSVTTQPQPREVANHKAIFGICVDPSSPHRVATYADGGTVYMWDTRQFVKPVYSFSRNGSIARLSWLNTRPGCLSVLTSEPPYLHLVDVPSYTQPTNTQADVGELYEHLTQHMSDRCPYIISKSAPHARLTGVSWHRQLDNLALVVNSEGVVRDLRASDKMPLSWGARSNSFVYGSSSGLFDVSLTDKVEADVSTLMKRRLSKGYGFDVSENIDIVADDPVLFEVWSWLKLYKEMVSRSPDKTHPGVLGTLQQKCPETEEFGSRCVQTGASGKEVPPFPTYTSPERQQALLLCGWSFGSSMHTLEDFLKREELKEDFERAAAIAVFQGQVRRSIASLKDGASVAMQQKDFTKASLFNLIALALSGYAASEACLWHETCSGIKANIKSPYLRAAFNFLCSNGESFSDVLNEDEISFQDRVALACTYLTDSQLMSYVSQLSKMLIESGRITGLFLTGLTEDGISLLSNYVDNTGDVQTACLVVGQVMQFACKYQCVKSWFQGYSGLMDQWHMWQERALFDCERKKRNPKFKPQKQAFVACRFCGKSIASDARQDRRAASRYSASGQRANGCPGCHKPLPRCSICLMHMAVKPRDTASTGLTGTQKPLDQFGQWFAWCQTCRHGGHASHIAQWFSEHKQCPVTGCSCTCSSLD